MKRQTIKRSPIRAWFVLRRFRSRMFGCVRWAAYLQQIDGRELYLTSCGDKQCLIQRLFDWAERHDYDGVNIVIAKR